MLNLFICSTTTIIIIIRHLFFFKLLYFLHPMNSPISQLSCLNPPSFHTLATQYNYNKIVIFLRQTSCQTGTSCLRNPGLNPRDSLLPEQFLSIFPIVILTILVEIILGNFENLCTNNLLELFISHANTAQFREIIG